MSDNNPFKIVFLFRKCGRFLTDNKKCKKSDSPPMTLLKAGGIWSLWWFRGLFQ